MNEKKFCFISCVNNEEYYNETIAYINSLFVPEEYEVEILNINNAKSIAAGYNEAMKMSDAKYKIYLQQNTFIINKNFLLDILITFNKDNNIGMIGAVGCKKMPTSGMWFESESIIGGVYENNTLFKKNSIVGKYEEVEGIAGFLISTQYDVPWREDIFEGWDFYDVSQVIEFKKKGYKTVIQNQQETWCIHDKETGNLKNDFNQSRIKYLCEYSKEIFPLVSILIPTYNRPEYFELALKSVLDQTYKNLEIIIGDDSSNNETEKVVQKYISHCDNIKYFHNKITLGQFDNDLKLLEMASGRYINFLMDDDLFEPNKIEKMMNYFIADDKNEISLVTSNRKLIDGNGNFIGNYILKESIDEIGDIIWEGNILSELFLSQNKNIIGEPTTVLFDKSKLSENFGYFLGRRCICNVDQGTWLNLLSNGKGVIIKEALSSFRKHSEQQLNCQNNIIGGALDYSYMIINAKQNGLFIDEVYFAKAIKNCYEYVKQVNNEFSDASIAKCLNRLKEEYKVIKKSFKMVSCIIKNDDIQRLNKNIKQISNQTYPNILINVICEKEDQLTDENEFSNITYFKYNNKLSYNENINRIIEKKAGDYFIVLDNQIEIKENLIENMMKAFKIGVGVVVEGIKNVSKTEYISNEFARKFLINNYRDFASRRLTIIIDRSYFNTQYSNYYNQNYIYIQDMSTVFNCLRFGDLALIPDEFDKNIVCFSKKEIIMKTIETLILAFQLKDDRVYSNMNEYKSLTNQIYTDIKAKIEDLSDGEKDKLINLSESIFKQIDLVEYKDFYNIGGGVEIRGGCEFVCKEGIDIGNNILIKEDSTFMLPYYNYQNGPKIIIKDGCDLGKRLFVSATNKITIEEEVIIASNVHITDHNHEYRKIGIPIRKQGVTSFANEVVIGAGSWIANNCVIVGNVKIGRGCVIGANSVVLEDIPDYSVAVGSPAKIIKYFDRIKGEWVKYVDKSKYQEYKDELVNRRPLLTIGILTYNRASYLDKCLTDIFKQVGNDSLIEVLVCDNCSTDATERVANKYKSQYSNFVYHKNEKNIGAIPNLMKVLEIANGEFVNTHGDDDYFEENAIYQIVEKLYQNRESSLVFTLPNKSEIQATTFSGIDEFIEEVSYFCTWISGIIINKESFDKINDKNKFIHTELNQVYLELELLRENPKFTVITGKISTGDSGERNPSGYNFAKVFIKTYLDILHEYVGKGLSQKVFSDEKYKLLDKMVLPWINRILNEDIRLDLENIFEIYDKYYSDEEYYEEKRNTIKNLISRE